MGKMQREKGKRFERIVAGFFRDWGYDAHRTAQYRGNTGKAGDIEGVPYIHIEAKHQERMNLYEWMEQSVSDARAEGEGNLPIVVHHANLKPILVTMQIEHWIQLYNSYYSAQELLRKWGITDEIKE